MSEMLWLRSHVELMLANEWGVCRVVADPDGDYFYRYGAAACWVRIIDSEHPMVRVFAHAVCGVRRTAKLLTELNEIQNRSISATVGWRPDTVMVSQTVSAVGLTEPVLAQAMAAVGGLADEVGVLIAGMFGGATPFEAEVRESEDAD